MVGLLHNTNRRIYILTTRVLCFRMRHELAIYTEPLLTIHRRPYHGEIDILEGANDQQNVLTSLHTAGTCSIAGSNETGTLQASNCTYDVATGANSAGCGVSDPDTSSFGLQFNSNRGGVYAMEWTSEAIKVWFWSRSSIPLNILSGRPDPSTWGLPDANMAGSCDFDSNFQNHQIVIDNTFCGDWAGNTWGNSCQASTGVSTCAQYVGENPSAFSNMYWDINSIKVYTSTSASSTTTSSCTTTTPSYTTPTVSTTLSTTTRGPYTTPAISSWGTSTTPVPFQNMTWGTTTQISSSSVSTPLKSVAPQGSLVGVPMGGGVGITRTVSGHGFSQPTNTVSTGHNARAGSSTAADGWKSSSSTSSSTSAYNWKPSSSVPSSTASVSDDGQDWSNWESSETSSTFTSTVTLDPVWPDWSSSSSSVPTSSSSWADWTQSASPSSTSTSSSSSWVEWTQSTSSSSTTSTSSSSSWADWSQSSTVTIAVSTLTVSPVQYSAMPAATTYNNAWGSGSSSTISPIAAAATSGANAWSSAASPAATSGANAWPSAAAASSSSGANAWSSAASPASYNANSTTSAWVAAYTGAASRQNPVAIAGSAIFAAVGIVVASMVL